MSKKSIIKAVTLILVFSFLLCPIRTVESASTDHLKNIQSFNLDLNNDNLDDYNVVFYYPEGAVTYRRVPVVTKDYRYMQTSKYKFIQYHNNAESGYAVITVNKFPNNDYMFFVDYFSTLDNLPLGYEVKLPGMNKDFTIRTAKQSGNKCEITPDAAAANQPLSNSVRYIDSSQKYLKFSKVLKAKNLGYSVYDIDVAGPVCNLIQSGNTMTFKYSLSSSRNAAIKSSWILSSKPLVNWSHDLAYRSLLNMDIKNDNYYFSDGVYRINMSNYVPRSKPGKSYFKNPSGLQVRACKWVLDQGSLFNDMGIYTMYSYANSYNDKGYIPTQPRSEWLSEDFGIGFNFYDTRFNSDTINSLIPFYYHYPDEYVLSKIRGYIKFYKKFFNDKKFIADKNIFVPDYMDYSGKNKRTHCSLNHFISEAQALYLYYEVTGDLEALDIARSMTKSICNTSSKWIKKDGDLWYKIVPTGSYASDDYPLVTYNDLVNFTSLLKRIEKGVPAGIAKMLERKANWAIKRGYIA